MMHPGRMKWNINFLSPINSNDEFGQQVQTFEVYYKTRFQEKTWGDKEETQNNAYFGQLTRRIICRRNRRCPLDLSHKAWVEDEKGTRKFFHLVDIREIDNRNGYEILLAQADIDEIPLSP